MSAKRLSAKQAINPLKRFALKRFALCAQEVT